RRRGPRTTTPSRSSSSCTGRCRASTPTGRTTGGRWSPTSGASCGSRSATSTGSWHPEVVGLIGVTGATGHIGGRVARKLAAGGAQQRLVVRDAARAPALPGAEVAVATYADADALVEAFTGVDVLLLVSA